jgi:hypothetical protein
VKHTDRRLDYFEVTYIPEGRSEPEMDKLDPDYFREEGLSEDEATEAILEEYWGAGEPLSVIYVNNRGMNVNLWGNRRY